MECCPWLNKKQCSARYSSVWYTLSLADLRLATRWPYELKEISNPTLKKN